MNQLHHTFQSSTELRSLFRRSFVREILSQKIGRSSCLNENFLAYVILTSCIDIFSNCNLGLAQWKSATQTKRDKLLIAASNWMVPTPLLYCEPLVNRLSRLLRVTEKQNGLLSVNACADETTTKLSLGWWCPLWQSN